MLFQFLVQVFFEFLPSNLIDSWLSCQARAQCGATVTDPGAVTRRAAAHQVDAGGTRLMIKARPKDPIRTNKSHRFD